MKITKNNGIARKLRKGLNVYMPIKDELLVGCFDGRVGRATVMRNRKDYDFIVVTKITGFMNAG